MNEILQLVSAELGRIPAWAATTLRIFAIIVVAWIATAILRRVIAIVRQRIASRMPDDESVRRIETLGRVMRYIVTVVVSMLALMLVLSEIGISVAPILGAAGVVGVAVGFGAQSLVKDYFTGFFLLIENQIRNGDVVTVAAHSGMVEEITLRYVRLRDYSGHVHYIPNGKIDTVVNMSRGFAFAVMDVGVAYQENVDAVFDLMRSCALEMRADAQWTPKVLGDLEIAGVDQFADSAVVIRCRIRTLPLEQWAVRREYLRRLKADFDREGVEIPFPHLTLYAGHLRKGDTPALPVANARE